jgi:hypothetical protein
MTIKYPSLVKSQKDFQIYNLTTYLYLIDNAKFNLLHKEQKKFEYMFLAILSYY